MRGAAGTCAVAGVFKEVNRDGVVGRGSAEERGVVGAMHGVAGIAVEDEESDGWTGIGRRWEAAVSDDFALRIFPRLESPGEGFTLETRGVVFGREIDHRSLGESEESEESEPDEDSDPGDLPEAGQRGGARRPEAAGVRHHGRGGHVRGGDNGRSCRQCNRRRRGRARCSARGGSLRGRSDWDLAGRQ